MEPWIYLYILMQKLTTLNQIVDIMTSSEEDALTQLCEIERTQILTVLSLAQSNPLMARFLLTGNRSTFVHIKGASLWLNENQHYLLPLYTHKENCFDEIPIYYQDRLSYVDPISRQPYSFATEILCDGNPATIIALDSHGIEYQLFTPTPLRLDPPDHFNVSEIPSTIQPNTFYAPTLALYSSKHIKGFWNRILLRKHSDEAIEVLGKAIS